MAKRAATAIKAAFCVGINDYPGKGNDLAGCVNDANDWSATLSRQYGFPPPNVRVLTDAKATHDAIVSGIQALITQIGQSGIGVFTYSGHGTWVYDQGERDESDNRDEALCAVDRLILDDELRKILSVVPVTARLIVISDSCHSGSVTRAMLARNNGSLQRPRYMPPQDDADAIRSGVLPIKRRIMYPESGMRSLLLAGCNATEYSCDAFISNRYNGAFTSVALSVIRSNPKQTYRDLHKQVRRILPSSTYPQSPQLEGPDSLKDMPLFS